MVYMEQLREREQEAIDAGTLPSSMFSHSEPAHYHQQQERPGSRGMRDTGMIRSADMAKLEEEGKLEEVRESARSIFKVADKMGAKPGFLTKTEILSYLKGKEWSDFKEWLFELTHGMSRFTEYDRNKNGALESKELVEALCEYRGVDPQPYLEGKSGGGIAGHLTMQSVSSDLTAAAHSVGPMYSKQAYGMHRGFETSELEDTDRSSDFGYTTGEFGTTNAGGFTARSASSSSSGSSGLGDPEFLTLAATHTSMSLAATHSTVSFQESPGATLTTLAATNFTGGGSFYDTLGTLSGVPEDRELSIEGPYTDPRGVMGNPWETTGSLGKIAEEAAGGISLQSLVSLSRELQSDTEAPTDPLST